MIRRLVYCIALLISLGCASGPHPTLALATKDLDCPSKELTPHEIYPNKYRVEGCDKEQIYVRGCEGYGADAECDWVKLK